MEKETGKEKQISRRGFLPILGGGLLLPLLGFGNTDNADKADVKVEDENEEYQTLLKPDGTVVKVKVSSIKKAKVVKQNLSNKSFLKWLGKKP